MHNSYQTKRVYIFGSGELGRQYVNNFEIKIFNIEIAGFIDNDPAKQNMSYLGKPVYSVDRFNEIKSEDDSVIVAISDWQVCKQVIKQLEVVCGLKYNINVFDNLGYFFSYIPDDEYCKVLYKARFGEEINLDNPKTYNEKIQWLKLYDRNPLYTTMADKIAAREYVSSKIGSEYVVPMYGAWDYFDEIDFDQLPNEFVLKCNHDCGSFVVCKDKNTFDFERAKQKLENALTLNFYLHRREWVYKDIKPQILAEKYMGFIEEDYRFVVFNGEVKFFYCGLDWAEPTRKKFNIYLPDLTYIPVRHSYPTNPNYNLKKPKHFAEMMEVSIKLAERLPLLRVDLWQQQGQVYVNELTFYQSAGFGIFDPEEWDEIIGSWLVLPERYGVI